mmetsp:Transcript_29891/g.86907  ORF Transcript_29891/g.86907 Transcript_29891/m.86907 type:complete len:936 (+) Transcript_29891:94-2901(+)
MGTTGSCCCQKVPTLIASDDPARQSKDDSQVFDGGEADPISMSNPCALENKERAAERRGANKRIGAKIPNAVNGAASGDGPEEEYLVHYRRPRKMGMQTRKLIKVGMKQDRVCALLDEPELEAILETMEYYEFAAGDVVVEQGKVGTTFFVTHRGSVQVSVNGQVMNTLAEGRAFGGLALLYHCPRTATVKAVDSCGVWGANGGTFHKVLQENAQKHSAENRKFLDSIRLFDGLTNKQKDRVAEVFFTEVFEAGARVTTEGDTSSAIYFVKKGELSICKGGTVKASGEFVDGREISRLGPGDCFGERAMLHNDKQEATAVSQGRSECICISVKELREILGSDLAACLERNFVLQGLRKSPIISQFSSSQLHEIVKALAVKDYPPDTKIEDGHRFVIVVDGQLSCENGGAPMMLHRGNCYEDGALIETGTEAERGRVSVSLAVQALDQADGRAKLSKIVVGQAGARLAVLTQEGLAKALKELGLSAIGSAEEASDYTRKMVLAKKVHIFRHLSHEQTNKLVKSFRLQRYRKGAHVIKQGEVGSSFFVIASGEVTVLIGGNKVRTLAKNAYFGERALLFDEPRTATVEVSSSEAELWSVEKSTFSQIVKGNMQQELMHRIRLQDTNLTLKDVRQVRIIGAGAAGVVRLVQHKKTGTRYALKRVYKQNGKVPEEVARECSLLAENDHPFIMALVKTFETANSVYMLTELITGGELHAAIRQIPTVLSRAQAQFYVGSLAVVLEELCDRNILYRDLKPENVMLDQQGYLKLIDFGIAKKLEEGKSKTFTMIGTPHYMAPEVMRGHGYGTEVDLWSLGVMLFEFVCGYLPFADELDDPTEVCTAVLKDPLSFPSRYRDQSGKTMMQGLLCRQPKKRLGTGINGYEDVKNADYFKSDNTTPMELFNRIMGRELDPPVIPQGETYCDPDDAPATLSDAGELG